MTTPLNHKLRAAMGPRVVAALVSGLAAGTAAAHPGHTATPTLGFMDSVGHLLTQPDHVAMLVLAVVVGVAGAKAWRARRAARRSPPQRRR